MSIIEKRNQEKRCRGAIFDMDGLMFDTEKVFQETWHELAKEREIELPEDFVQAITGTSGEHMNRVLEHYYQVADGVVIREECMKRVGMKLEKEVPKKAGIDELLMYLKEKGYRLAVASSSPQELIEHHLKKAGVSKYFDAVVSGTRLEHGKPAPDIFLLAAEKISCDPKECYVFEDSANGVKAGYAAGCVTVMVPDQIPPSEEIKALDIEICSSLGEAQKLIQKCEKF